MDTGLNTLVQESIRKMAKEEVKKLAELRKRVARGEITVEEAHIIWFGGS